MPYPQSSAVRQVKSRPDPLKSNTGMPYLVFGPTLWLSPYNTKQGKESENGKEKD